MLETDLTPIEHPTFWRKPLFGIPEPQIVLNGILTEHSTGIKSL